MINRVCIGSAGDGKKMKNDELVEHLLENHRERILTEKNGETSHE